MGVPEFPVLVESHFNWLRGCGLLPTIKEETRVVYSNESVSLTVYHGRSSWEVGIEIGFGSFEDEVFSMSELLRLGRGSGADSYRNPIAVDAFELEKALKMQSERLKESGETALTGEQTVIAQLKNNRDSWSKKYELETRLEQARPLADAAFRDGDYNRVCELLAPLESALSPAESKKLKFALRKNTGA